MTNMTKRIAGLCIVAAFLIFPGCTPVEKHPAVIIEPPPIITSPRPSAPIYKPPAPPVKIPTFGMLKGKTIIVDAGHGGKDPGSLGTGFSTMSEKKINLSMATEIAKQLKEKGAKVIMTRTSDRFIELDDRAAMATRYRADLFVAIHSNSNPDSSRRGAVVYTARQPSRLSMVAAMIIDKSIRNVGILSDTDRADYKVLTLHSRPAVLVECGYLSNYSDCKRLNSSAYRTQIATAIVTGVANYFAR
ncbi:MAG: N-acetylmuramoyl-L-alanine amidase [Sedimentisphaerales bacterium]|nr:N-acetylmuramoyl-L-alanine amidase [Sedimentisphaerales bacterium]